MEGQGSAPASTAQAAAEGTENNSNPGLNNPGAPAEDSAQGNAVKAAALEAKRKLKIDDQEIDEDEVVKIYKERKGHQSAANKTLQEGLKAKRQTEEFVRMMKDPQKLIDTLYKLGYDKKQVRQLSEEFLATELSEEMMDPKERELRDTRNRLKTYEEREAQAKEEAQKREIEAQKKHFSEKYTAEFIDALKQTNLPPTKRMIGEMAGYIARSAKIKLPMTAIEAAKLVKEDEEARVKHRLGNADAEEIIRILGEEGLQKVRTYDVQKLKDPNAFLKTPGRAEQTEVRRSDKSTTRMTPQEWRRHKAGR
jgi:hypothetical protein